MELTKITKELLAQGWTKDQTPEGFRPWNDFYGGWEYKRSTYAKFVFETPCGMLIMGDKVISDMSYMGVHWMVENDNPVINCPFYGLGHCPVRHTLLQDKYLYNYISRCGNYKHCAVHRTDNPWVYDNSVEKVLDDNQREEDALWEIFKAKHKGRACKHQSHYDRSEKKWHMVSSVPVRITKPTEFARMTCRRPRRRLGRSSPVAPYRQNSSSDILPLFASRLSCAKVAISIPPVY